MIASPESVDKQRWQRHHAARVVAANAHDATELAELLAMLGLRAEEGRFPPERIPATEQVPAPRPPSPDERVLATTLLAAVTDSLG
jgi:hypothetical protein